jgi:hypothetical protein
MGHRVSLDPFHLLVPEADGRGKREKKSRIET